MNASLGLRLASRLVFQPCLYAGTSTVPLYSTPLTYLRAATASRTIWTSIQPTTLKPALQSPPKIRSPLTSIRSVSFNRRARPSPRTRQAPPPLPAPPEPSIAKPATITGAEQEAIRYTDYIRPEGSSAEEPLPQPPVSPTQKATSRYIGLFGVIFLIIHLLWYTPTVSAWAHSDVKETMGEREWFRKYVTPWRYFTERWFTFSPAVALERFGFNDTGKVPKEEREYEGRITKFTQFLLPTLSHSEIWHLAFNFFGLQALAPTIVRFYGFKRALIAYPTIGALGLGFMLAFDRLMNPYTRQDVASSIARYGETHGRTIRNKFGVSPTKEQTEENWWLGMHSRPGLGASGVLYGFLAITAIVNPMAKFELMFIPVGISVRTLFMAFVGIDMVGIGLRGEKIGNIGHLGGAAAGLLVWALWLRRVRLPDEVRRQLMMGLRRKKMGLD